MSNLKLVLNYLKKHPEKAKDLGLLDQKRKPTPKQASHLEETLLFQLKAVKLPEPTREMEFHPLRRWRFDFAYPQWKLAIEVEGGITTGGRHTRAAGYQADLEKYNMAATLGWHVLRFSGEDVRGGQAVQFIQFYLQQKGLI